MTKYTRKIMIIKHALLNKHTLQDAIIALSIFAGALLAGAQQANFRGLGDLPGGDVASYAFAVSADGTTVVGWGISSNGVEAFRWRDGVMVGLGSLPGSTFGSRATGVSGDGSIVVGRSRSTRTLEGFRWENGSMVGLGIIAGYSSSSAERIARDGQTIIGGGHQNLELSQTVDYSAYTAVQGIVWTNGVPIALGYLPSGLSDSYAQGVNANGTVIVGRAVTFESQPYEACRWVNGTISGLGFLPGGVRFSFAVGVSTERAVIVGNSSSARSVQGREQGEACRWDNGVPSGLGDIDGGVFDSTAMAISDDGEVIVGIGTSNTGREAFVWDRVMGIRPLKAVLESLELDLTGWILNDAIGISGDGTVITGSGTHNGIPEGWVAQASRTELVHGLGIRMTVKVTCLDICWNTKTNKTYQVQYRSDFTSNNWTDLGSPISGNGSTNCIADTVNGVENRFYQVIEQP